MQNPNLRNIRDIEIVIMEFNSRESRYLRITGRIGDKVVIHLLSIELAQVKKSWEKTD